MYLNWKSTINYEECENKKVNFKTYERIVSAVYKTQNINNILKHPILIKII